MDPAPLADEQLGALDARALVVRALAALDLDKRAVFVLHDLDGLEAHEIARTLDLPVFTVYSRLRVAPEKFAAAVRRMQKRGKP
jgi:RNA polymerase sigma-70 factor (ECF subfamily)